MKLFINFAETVAYLEAFWRDEMGECCFLIANDELYGIYMRKKLYIYNWESEEKLADVVGY